MSEKIVREWAQNEKDGDLPRLYRVGVYSHNTLPDVRYCILQYADPRLPGKTWNLVTFNAYPDGRLEVLKDKRLRVRELLDARELSWLDAPIARVDRVAMTERLKELIKRTPKPYMQGVEAPKGLHPDLRVAFVVCVSGLNGRVGCIPVTVLISKKEKAGHFSRLSRGDTRLLLGIVVRPEIDDPGIVSAFFSQVEARRKTNSLIFC